MADNLVNVKFTADIANLQSGLNQARTGLQSFGNVGNTVMGSLASIAGTVGVAFATSQAIETFKTWESGLIDLGTELGKLRDNEVPRFSEALKNLSVSSGTNLRELTSGLTELISKGMALGNEQEALNQINKLSVSTNSALGQSISAVAVVMNQFGAQAGTLNQVTDKIFETMRSGAMNMGEFEQFMKRIGVVANGVGVSFDELASITAFLLQKQVPFRVAQQALVTVMQDLQKLSPERIAMFKQEGIAIDEHTVKEKGLGYAMAELSKLSDESLQKIMPNIRNREVLTLITKNYNEVEQKRLDIVKSGGVVEEEYKKRQADLAQLTKQLSASLQVLSIEVLTPLVPVIKQIIEQVIVVAKEFRQWAKDNPVLLEHIVKLVAGLGAVILIGTNVITIITAVGSAFSGLVFQIGVLIPKIVSAWETLQLLGMYAGGPMILAIGALVIEIAIITKALYDWWKANERLKASQNEIAGIVRLNTNNMIKQMDDLVNKYSDLTAVEQERIKGVKEEAQALLAKTAIAMEDNKVTAEESKVLRDAVLELKAHTIEVENAVEGRKHQAEAVKGVADNEEELNVKMKEAEIVEKEKEARLNFIVLKYIELAKQYDIGGIKTDEFRAKLEALVLSGQAVTGTMDDIINKIKGVAESDFSISLKVRLETLDVVNDMKEKLLQAQEDLVLNHAQGETKKRMQIEITERRALRAIAVEMEAQALKYKEAIRMIDAEATADIASARFKAIEKGMIESEYITYRRGLWDADKAKQEALFAEQKKIQQDLIAIIKDTSQVELDLMDGKVGKHEKLNEEYLKRLKLLDEEKFKILDVLWLGTGQPQPSNLPSVLSGGVGSNIGSMANGVLEFKKMPAFGEVPMGQPYRVVGGYAEGTNFVPMTGVYQLHRGEKVLPADVASGGGGSNVTIVTLLDPKLVPEIMSQYPNAILNVVNSDILRNGITRRNIKSVK